MRVKKKKFDPPTKLYVIFDVESGNPLVVSRDPEEAFDGEAIQEYYLKERKKK